MRELNWKAGQAAELTVLSEEAGVGPVTGLPVRILELSGKRMRLESNQQLKPGAAIRLEWDGQMLLGLVQNVEAGNLLDGDPSHAY